MSVTMKEIAMRAGVSLTAVSFVLNGKNDGHVSAAKARVIQDLAQSLGYRPNISARNLRGCCRKLIGVLMSMSRDTSAMLFTRLLQSKLRERGYMALFAYWSSYEEVASRYQAVLEHRVDGIISWENPTPELAGTTPQVIYYSPACLRYDTVSIDNRSMIRAAVDRFLAAGRSRVAVVDSKGSSCYRECRQYLKEKGLPPPIHWDNAWDKFARFLSEFEQPLESFPDAIFVHNDVQAEVLARYIRGRGLRIPAEVMLIGCNNLLEFLPEEPLPTFDIHHEQIVDNLLRLLFQRISSPQAPISRVMVSPTYISSLNKAIFKLKQRRNPK